MNQKSENNKKLKDFFGEEYQSLKVYVNSRIKATASRDAEDIIQDVALKLFAGADRYSPINNVAGFVYNSIKNKISKGLALFLPGIFLLGFNIGTGSVTSMAKAGTLAKSPITDYLSKPHRPIWQAVKWVPLMTVLERVSAAVTCLKSKHRMTRCVTKIPYVYRWPVILKTTSLKILMAIRQRAAALAGIANQPLTR